VHILPKTPETRKLRNMSKLVGRTAMISITSAEFQKSFGRYREVAQREPVAISAYGRDSLVLLSAEEYRRLKRQDRRALHPWELDPDAVAALEAAEPPADAARFDDELKP
jgi:prevent-host-death family protein